MWEWSWLAPIGLAYVVYKVVQDEQEAERYWGEQLKRIAQAAKQEREE